MRKYRGDYRDLDDLEHGGVVTIKRPNGSTPAFHAASVRNAVFHLSRSRGRRFKTRQAIGGAIVVKRIYTDAEIAALWAELG